MRKLNGMKNTTEKMHSIHDREAFQGKGSLRYIQLNLKNLDNLEGKSFKNKKINIEKLCFIAPSREGSAFFLCNFMNKNKGKNTKRSF